MLYVAGIFAFMIVHDSYLASSAFITEEIKTVGSLDRDNFSDLLIVKMFRESIQKHSAVGHKQVEIGLKSYIWNMDKRCEPRQEVWGNC